MGSERKSKKRRSPSNSISEDEGRSKKHRTRDDKERSSSSKREKKSHKLSKHSNHSDKGKKSGEKHNRKHHKRNRHSDFQELSNDDYYSKNNEFATWLKEEKGMFFSDLSSEAAHELFSGFIKAWNNQKLESRYYEGIASGPRTAHNWKITPKCQEQVSLNLVRA